MWEPGVAGRGGDGAVVRDGAGAGGGGLGGGLGGADAGGVAEAARLFARQAALRRWHVARPHKPKLLGCHFSLFREDVERVNGFDENFVGWGYEDDDFARRLYKSGVEPRSVIEEARAMHLWHASLAPQALERHRDRPNRAYFRRWGVPARCINGLRKGGRE